jgi:hypothetical protein
LDGGAVGAVAARPVSDAREEVDVLAVDVVEVDVCDVVLLVVLLLFVVVLDLVVDAVDVLDTDDDEGRHYKPRHVLASSTPPALVSRREADKPDYSRHFDMCIHNCRTD